MTAMTAARWDPRFCCPDCGRAPDADLSHVADREGMLRPGRYECRSGHSWQVHSALATITPEQAAAAVAAFERGMRDLEEYCNAQVNAALACLAPKFDSLNEALNAMAADFNASPLAAAIRELSHTPTVPPAAAAAPDPLTRMRQRAAERQQRGQERAQAVRSRGGRNAGRTW